MSVKSTPHGERAQPLSAAGEIAAAERLAADPDLGPSLARSHMAEAWNALYEAAETDEDLLSWSGSQGGRQVADDERERFDRVRRWVLNPEESEADPTADDVFAHAAVLRALAGSTDERRSGFAVAGATLVVLTMVTMVAAAFVSLVRGPTGPWRGEWFDNQDFGGEPHVEHTRKLEFNWGREAPKIPGIGRDRWSVIWRTCLEVDEDTEVRFRVSSDDGTRVYVDGELVVDNWGAHAVRTRNGKKALTAGSHYLRVDFFEASATAEVKVLASFGEDREYESIPVSMLSEPGSGEDPC